MSDKNFETIEEDGIIIYDERDDYVPQEDADTAEFHLLTNEEIFTDKYMHDYASQMDAKIAREKRIQRLISIGVILAIIAYTGFLIAVIL